MALRSRNKVSPAFSMSSMTDIVFLLLIFFMITSTLVSPPALKLLVPKGTHQEPNQPPVATISIKDLNDGTFKYAVNRNIVTWEEIEPLLLKQFGDKEKPTVSLHAEETVPINEVVKIMNIAQKNKFRLILATRPE